MSLGAFTLWAVQRAVDLVNLFDDRAEPVTREQLHDLVDQYGWEPDDLRVDAFADLAGRLREVFEAADQGSRIERLNVLLGQFQPSPRVVEHDEDGPHFHYVASDPPPVDHIGAAFVMALANAFVDQGADRFGWCADPACGRLFYDRSRSRSQRYCSRSCSTRVNVAAHRARS